MHDEIYLAEVCFDAIRKAVQVGLIVYVKFVDEFAPKLLSDRLYAFFQRVV